MKFREFYGNGRNLRKSRLADGWSMPPIPEPGHDQPNGARAREQNGRVGPCSPRSELRSSSSERPDSLAEILRVGDGRAGRRSRPNWPNPSARWGSSRDRRDRRVGNSPSNPIGARPARRAVTPIGVRPRGPCSSWSRIASRSSRQRASRVRFACRPTARNEAQGESPPKSVT